MLPESGEPARRSMTPFRATAWVGLGSAASMLFGVISMKAYAIRTGPEGVGLIGLMLSLVNVGVILASAGVTTAVIPALSSAMASGDLKRAERVRQAAIGTPVVIASLTSMLLVLLREPAGELVLGSASRSGEVVVLAAALTFATAAFANLSILSGRREIRALTIVTISTAVAATVVGVTAVWQYGIGGLALAVLAGSALHLLFSTWFVRRAKVPRIPRATLTEVAHTSRDLLRSGLPIAASQLFSAVAVLAVPVLILHLLGTSEVGFYRAATAVSVACSTLLLGALTQDYLPRASAATNPHLVSGVVERQMRLILGLGAPALLALMAVGPIVLQALFSAEFIPSFAVLQWQLVGDLLRMPAAILAFVLLATGQTRSFVLAELSSGLGLLIATPIGIRLMGLEGAGFGYAAAQVAFYVAVWLLVRRHIPTRPGRLQIATLLVAVASALIVVADPMEPLRTILFGVGALTIGAMAWPRLIRLLRAGEL